MLTPKSPSKQCGEKINLDEYQRPNQRPRTKSHPLSLKISENTLLKKKIHQAREEVYCLFALGWKLIDGKCVVLIDSNKFFFKFDSLLEKFDQKYFY